MTPILPCVRLDGVDLSKRARWKKKDPDNERGRTAIRYRAYPTPSQTGKVMRIAGSCRFVKNLAKEQWDLAHRLGTRSPSYTRQSAELKELRDDPKLTPWLAEVPSQILQQAIRDTDIAYRRFFSGQSRYPTWARKGSRASFRDPQDVKFRRLSRRWGEVKIQGVGWVQVRAHRSVVGSRITSATVTMEPDGKMFISVLCERHKRMPTKQLAPENTTFGIDRGVAVAIATSDGELINRENWTPKEKERLRRLERACERKSVARKSEHTKEKGALFKRKSGKQEKTELAIATMYGRARRRRKDFVEQVSRDLAKNHRLSVFEDLRLSAMTRSARGPWIIQARELRKKLASTGPCLTKLSGPYSYARRTRSSAMAMRPCVFPHQEPRSPAQCRSAAVWIRPIEPAGRYSCVSPADIKLMRTSMPQSSSVSGGSNSLSPVERRWQPSEATTRSQTCLGQSRSIREGVEAGIKRRAASPFGRSRGYDADIVGRGPET